MRQDIQKDQPANRPLSTAALAHADDQAVAENRAQERAQERTQEHSDRRPDPALREADRPALEGGPSLVPPASARAAKPLTEQSRTDVGANRQTVGEEEQASPLFSPQESKDFFARWDALQVGFIDEPRRAVEQADNLVAATMKRLAEVFSEERARLEHQWDRGDNVSTEDLRVAMRRYRSFFRRLLAV